MELKYIKVFETFVSNEELDYAIDECAIFINDLKKCKPGSFLIRGVWEDVDVEEFYPYYQGRTPENTPYEVHDKLNDLFNKKFGWYVRNGVFCFGSETDGDIEQPFDTEYGSDTYLVFPTGKYDIVWNEEIKDLFYEIDFIDERKIDEYEKDIQEIVDTYVEGDLCDAIESGNEICIDCNSYYLINQKYIKKIIHRIWN